MLSVTSDLQGFCQVLSAASVVAGKWNKAAELKEMTDRLEQQARILNTLNESINSKIADVNAVAADVTATSRPATRVRPVITDRKMQQK
jgi:outer membrane murein-binding lipoprotein Lpp